MEHRDSRNIREHGSSAAMVIFGAVLTALMFAMLAMYGYPGSTIPGVSDGRWFWFSGVLIGVCSSTSVYTLAPAALSFESASWRS
jgi:hypothetical protein